MTRPARENLACNGLFHTVLGHVCPDPERGQSLFIADDSGRPKSHYTVHFSPVDPTEMPRHGDSDRPTLHVEIQAKKRGLRARYLFDEGRGCHDEPYEGPAADPDERQQVIEHLLGRSGPVDETVRQLLRSMFGDLLKTLRTSVKDRTSAAFRWLDRYFVRDPEGCPFKLASIREQKRAHALFYDLSMPDGKSLRFPRHLAFEYLYMRDREDPKDFFDRPRVESIPVTTHAALMTLIVIESILPLKVPKAHLIREPLRAYFTRTLDPASQGDLGEILATLRDHKSTSVRAGINKINTAVNASLRGVIRGLPDRMERRTCLLCNPDTDPEVQHDGL